MSTALVWLRRDLRLVDHPALTAACRAHDRVLPVYIHAPDEDAPWAIGAASRWWLHHSLQALDRSLRVQGGALHVAAGNSLTVLRRLAEQASAATVYWTRCYEPAAIARDTATKAALRSSGIAVESHPGNLWREPWQILQWQGKPYRIFGPFWRRLYPQLQADTPLAECRARMWLRVPGSLPLEALLLEPRIPWADGFTQMWQPGENGARAKLTRFRTQALADYGHGRERPGRPGTSQLSPHLHFGEVTPRQILHTLLDRETKPRAHDITGIEPYLRELGWREFAHHLLYHFPATPERNFNPRFDRFHWAEADETALHAWQRGLTGVPLVDAGMRELWRTGWMHNRVRMVAASFLTKNLRLHWQYGARWFWDTLVDADLANNTLGWQWVAGSGADASPYFRIFNPFTQAARFDPDAAYLKRWLPELAELPPRLLHEPRRDQTALASRGYPAPIVDVTGTRQAALEAWKAIAPN